MSLKTTERVELVKQADEAIHDYQKSRAFTEDLLRAFASASEQARQENERLGLTVSTEPEKPANT